jgi:tetratricopeptide (TPR) repeat protein
VDGDSTKAAQVTVDLMDALNLGSAMDSKLTDNDGNVVFQTNTGPHRIRITGPNIETYDGELEIARNETSHMERIRVRAAPGSQPAVSQSSFAKSSVPAVRLNVPAAARKAYDQASEAMRKQEWDKSRALFETAIHEYPQYDIAYNGLGAIQMQLNDEAGARKSFEKAIELNPDFAGANRNLARLLLRDHNNREALPLLLRSLVTEPDSIWALVNAANSELLMQNYDDAVLYARKAHALPHQDFATVHIVAARAFEATQQPDQAIAEYRLYLTEAPKGPDAQRAQAAISRLSGQPPQ